MAVNSGRQAIASILYSGGLFAGIVAGCRAERDFLGKAPGVKSGMPFHSAGSSGMCVAGDNFNHFGASCEGACKGIRGNYWRYSVIVLL